MKKIYVYIHPNYLPVPSTVLVSILNLTPLGKNLSPSAEHGGMDMVHEVGYHVMVRTRPGSGSV